MSNLSEFVIEAAGLTKSYSEDAGNVTVFADIDLQLRRAESLAILGSSGAGKTTLLNILGGLDTASSGSVVLEGVDLAKCSDRKMTQLRNQKLGFVYQFHHLLPEFSAVENVAMPLLISGIARKKAESKAQGLLETVGLGERLAHKPSQLSGGERQRVAIARALVNEPSCVLMDEPTGNLDQTTAGAIQQLMLSLQKELSTSFVIVTHDRALADKMDRALFLDETGLHPA